MKIMKYMTKKIRSKERMDAESRWWVGELLAADCEKACLHPGEEETMQKWYAWLEKMIKEDEKTKMEEMHQECERQSWGSAQDHEAHSMERSSADPEKEEEDVRLQDRCEAKVEGV